MPPASKCREKKPKTELTVIPEVDEGDEEAEEEQMEEDISPAQEDEAQEVVVDSDLHYPALLEFWADPSTDSGRYGWY